MLSILKCNLFIWWQNWIEQPFLSSSVSLQKSFNMLIWWNIYHQCWKQF